MLDKSAPPGQSLWMTAKAAAMAALVSLSSRWPSVSATGGGDWGEGATREGGEDRAEGVAGEANADDDGGESEDGAALKEEGPAGLVREEEENCRDKIARVEGVLFWFRFLASFLDLDGEEEGAREYEGTGEATEEEGEGKEEVERGSAGDESGANGEEAEGCGEGRPPLLPLAAVAPMVAALDRCAAT